LDKIKVLLIDDDQSVLDFFKAAAEKVNITITLTSTGIEGLHAAANDTFRIAFIGTQIKEIDGLQVLQQLKQQAPDLSCFVIVGSASDPVLPKAMAAGAKGAIYSPPDLDQVASSIQRMELIAFFEGEITRALERASWVENAEVKGLKKALADAKQSTETDVQ
jgi:DNA-binding NtrC family response regulator